MATLNELLNTATQRDLTDQERGEAHHLIAESNFVESSDIIAKLLTRVNGPQSMDESHALAMIENIIGATESELKNINTSTHVRRIDFLKTVWLRWAMAASILLFAGIGIYFWLQLSREKPGSPTGQRINRMEDIYPGHHKAILTLSDGHKIELDSAASETISDGALSIKNNQGQLLYPGTQSLGKRDVTSIVSLINTMTTPKGGQYQLTLSDGTKVWLNAASSITYPTLFNEHTREVKIEGEVYFEVAQNKSKPFIVQSGENKIMVLGTSFNINNYSDEPSSKISLIDGTIKVNEKLLKPGQAFTNGKIIQTNIEQDIAWKNGLFSFDKIDLLTALRQLARWYDITIRYEGKIPERRLQGEMGKTLTLQQVLNLLSHTHPTIQFELHGKTLLVKNK